MKLATRRWLLLGSGVGAVLLLLGLGVWQVQRLYWKTSLIERVETGLAAAPVAAPGPDRWSKLTFDTAEYRRISVRGHFMPSADSLVKAVTVRGSGFWVMSPFETKEGWRLFINRGFVTADHTPGDLARPEGQLDISGLLRLTQPNGAFLRSNDPKAGRWFSRDTAAMAQLLGLSAVAPYFLDAEAKGDGLPIGGLTVVAFPNSHLGYAITWFGLAGLLALLLFRASRTVNDPDE
ncbi:SURF1 family protein [Pararhizobium antarcticum]|uniref:SURF1-like protein n=1 Tax=Pararhizobium antarcticum TaxID=1798805 RepID=A0A657LT27_9HYPH|nr:SURF1 family cytochrome oxidase biogenesis protein [Pararhizobium antarcticum]OJF96388.1 Surfeit locus 1 family protein [Pararhizobium antarcticum]OJF96719.1 Surfeit locus 1 family protein [Rhizobium sp. 58]